jgi:hypothetical protein
MLALVYSHDEIKSNEIRAKICQMYLQSNFDKATEQDTFLQWE